MKSRHPFLRRVLPVSFIALFVLPFVLQAAEKSASYKAALESITGKDLLDRDSVLADEKLEGREAGTSGGSEARKYLIEQYTKLKLQPAGPEEKFEQPLPPNFCNIVGIIPGRDPALKSEYVLVEAHYDHVGRGHRGTSFDPGGIHPGADDNASGSSGLVELVEAFTFLAEPPKRSVLILATDGEEKGLVGSKYWAANPTVPLEKVVAAINMDMIGYLRNDRLFFYGARTGIGWRRLVSEQNAELRMHLDFGWQFKANNDAYPMFEKGVPALLVHTGVHENYHRTSDTPEKLNAAGMSRVVRLVFGLVHELAERPERIVHRPGAKQESAWTAAILAAKTPAPPSRLGVTLDCADGGEAKGVRLLKIEADSAAARAGLKEEDRILEFAGRKTQKCDELIGAVMTAPSPAKALVRGPNEEKPREIAIELSAPPLRLGITWRTDEAEPKSMILTYVVPGAPAAQAGLKPGDRIYQVAGRDFADENEFVRLIGAAADALDLLIERDGQIQPVHLDLKSAPPLKRAA
ncbi:MAG: M28 family peptidase [Pirellulales bacterium]|nr:M28 family peptidase [Pirellulales bacterium]